MYSLIKSLRKSLEMRSVIGSNKIKNGKKEGDSENQKLTEKDGDRNRDGQDGISW